MIARQVKGEAVAKTLARAAAAFAGFSRAERVRQHAFGGCRLLAASRRSAQRCQKIALHLFRS
jgi:hypothetical protein